ncbi:universal stress protein [Halorussus gelatinilyticus]|uniref:Universal stress protein n=1 Tax=Halorussus gelatinilyticus TaxID=2937524 RepID=A0A8U0IED2_9EURY|nr:universal stress protein [Halorussus gelatinilyticus]UPV99267.1 universal stress protein [Halorussus gelatinilyticus]
MYDRVLLPTDGSEAAEAAAEHAYSHADRYDAELHVLHVVPENESTSIVGRGNERLDTLEARGHDAVTPLVEDATTRDLSVTSAIEVGTPYRKILAYADDHDIDLIVMSTHGRSGVGRVVMGSVTERVIRVGELPVVAVQRS